MELSDLRHDFGKYTFNPNNTPENPAILFKEWLNVAANKEISDFNAMALSTVNSKGFPSSRIVLLKDFNHHEFTFFTNYSSRKGANLSVNPNACLLFFWKELERQVRIEGVVEKLNAEASDIYFQSRPIESQLSALASPQSKNINSLVDISTAIEKLSKTKGSLMRSENWGGYVLKGIYYEFWQGGANRLHQRLSYSYQQKNWIKEQLAP